MTSITTNITIYSYDGDSKYPAAITLKMDETKPECPITFWADDKPVFSFGAEEIPAFCKVLNSMDNAE
jgi:hypothetical protein